MRKTIKTLVIVLLALFTFSGISEAAPRHVVRHRVARRVTVVKKVVRKNVKRAAHATKRTTHRIVSHRATTKPR